MRARQGLRAAFNELIPNFLNLGCPIPIFLAKSVLNALHIYSTPAFPTNPANFLHTLLGVSS